MLSTQALTQPVYERIADEGVNNDGLATNGLVKAKLGRAGSQWRQAKT